ncbi:MAG: hypothetical protein WDN03_08820 [Rhizomicrobium sp.]
MGWSWDVAILAGMALCQGATGYWAFHVSTEHRLARWGFSAVTAIGIALIVWSGMRSETSSKNVETGIETANSQLKRIAEILHLNPDMSPTAIADAVAKRLVTPVYDIEGGTKYWVPNVTCVVNVRTDSKTGQTDIYLPAHPFSGQAIDVHDLPRMAMAILMRP